MSSAGSKDETLEGRIAAVAHLSAARALVECAREAMEEYGVMFVPDTAAVVDTRGELIVRMLDRLADEIMEPCEIANVLQTVEEVIATGALRPIPMEPDDGRPGKTNVLTIGVDRAAIVRALVDVRQAAKDDEREPTDHELANRHGVEGGIGYRTEPSMEDLLREKGDL